MHISLDSALGQQRRLNQVGESITQIAPDPAAAYSLRSLTGGDPKVVRVRRGSDNHEQDFTASDVSSGALQDFVNAQVVAPLDIQALSATGRDGDFLIAKAAYSLRSLGTRQATLAATGDTVARADGKYVCQVRRSSDDALKSFTADEITDGTLLSFVGTGGSDNGFVKTWYDQSVSDQAGTATGNHATQATAASQPKIVNAGSLLNELDFDGTDDTLAIDFGADLSQANSFFIVHHSDTTTANSNDLFDSATSANPRTLLDQSGSDYRMFSGGVSAGTGIAVTTDKSLIFALYNGSSSLFAKNGTATSALNAGTTDIKQNSTIGSSNTRFYDGSMQEFIIYNTDQTDNRTAIEANIGEVYSIDLPSGVDPGFDQVDGFVETWYDQSGNGKDATQATAGSQPKIVNAGALVVDSGIGGLDFDGDDFLTASSVSGLEGSISMFAVSVRDATGYVVSPSNSSAANRYFGIQEAASTVVANPRNTSNKTVSDSVSGNDRLTFVVTTGATSTSVGANGSAVTTTTDDYGDDFAGSNLDQIAIGVLRTVSASGQFNGRIREILVYSSDQTDNRTALETNINGHYSIF